MFRRALSRKMKILLLVAAVAILACIAGPRVWNRIRQGSPWDPVQGAIGLGPLTSPRIALEKSARRLTVYDGDKAVKIYRVALGPSRGDKAREGDKRTPEGEFYVCLKNPRSRFTLSLGLSYPNIEDARRGLHDGLINQAQHDQIVGAIERGGTPPRKTALGGESMIHGCGNRWDWTLGCIALNDDDVRELYRAIPVGTPVTILP